MVARPVVLRAHICRTLALRHPGGMSVNEIRYQLAGSLRAEEMHRIVQDMALDGLVTMMDDPRPIGRAVILLFVAAPGVVPLRSIFPARVEGGAR